MAIKAVLQVGGRSGQRWLMNGSHGDAGYHSTVTMAGRAGSAGARTPMSRDGAWWAAEQAHARLCVVKWGVRGRVTHLGR